MMSPLDPVPAEKASSRGRSRVARLPGVQIVGVGSDVPDRVVTNQDLAALGYDAEWIVQRTGIHERRYALPGTVTSDLAVAAALRCMEQAGVSRDDVDLVLVATSTPDMPMPATASVVQDRLGLSALAFDIEAACSGFVYALFTAMQYVASGSSRYALAIGADCYSRVINPADPRTYPIFGDGAGAALVARGAPEQGVLACAVGSDGSGAELVYRGMGGSRLPYPESPDHDAQRFIIMEGRPVFKWAIRIVEETTRQVLDAAGVRKEDLALVVLHQANQRIIDAAMHNLGIPSAIVYNNVARYGNTSAASVALALDEAHRQGRVRRGDLVLLSGFGGGLSWGTMLMRW